MRSLCIALLVTVAIGTFAVACGLPEIASSPRVPKTFIYDRGWQIPGLEGASVIATRQVEDGSTEIRYKPARGVGVYIALQGFELSADGKSVRLVPGYRQVVEDIFGYRIQDHTYAYKVVTVSSGRANPPMWPEVRTLRPAKRARNDTGGILGCGWTVLRYFDSDGDGKFESLEYVGFGGPYANSIECPTTPEWALRLMPHRAAAERCATEAARRAAGLDPKTGLTPQPLMDLLNYRPVLPVLAPRAKN